MKLLDLARGSQPRARGLALRDRGGDAASGVADGDPGEAPPPRVPRQPSLAPLRRLRECMPSSRVAEKRRDLDSRPTAWSSRWTTGRCRRSSAPRPSRPLGPRLQVSAGRRRRPSKTSRSRWAARRVDAGRAPGAGAAGRHDGRGRRPQLRGPLAQGRAGRRHGSRREGRRRHPEGRPGPAGKASLRLGPVRDAGGLLPSAATPSSASRERSRRAASIPPARPSWPRRCATSARGTP